MKEKKQVSEQEFKDFLTNYPNQLERDVNAIFDPPMVSYNDFADGKVWPESVVAYKVLNKYRDENAVNDHYIYT